MILLILKMLVSLPKIRNQRRQLKNRLERYIKSYEEERANSKANLLLRVSQHHLGKPEDFKLIKLLLKGGANSNIGDYDDYTALHLIAASEFSASHLYGYILLTKPAQNH
jgi:hypothetical protein